MAQATVTMAVAALRSAVDDLMKSDALADISFPDNRDAGGFNISRGVFQKLSEGEPVSVRLIGIALSDLAFILNKENSK